MIINQQLCVPKTGFYLLLNDIIFSPAPPGVVEEFFKTGDIAIVDDYMNRHGMQGLLKANIITRISATEVRIPKHTILTCDTIDNATIRFLISKSYNSDLFVFPTYIANYFSMFHGTPFNIDAHFIKRTDRLLINSKVKKQELIQKIENGDLP